MRYPRISFILAVPPILFACSGGGDKKPPAVVTTLPQLTSANRVVVEENRRDDFFTLTATDADGDALRFSISGPDAVHFAIDPDTGALRFRQPANFEMPADGNGDNFYQFTTIVEDPYGGRDSQPLTVEVSNVEFAYEFLSPLPDTIVERERYSRLPIALWMEYDYPEPVEILCDGEIMNPASNSRMTWTGSIDLDLGRVNVECVFMRGEQMLESLLIPVRHQYVISDDRYLVYDALNDQVMIPHPKRLETLLIDAETGDSQKRYPWIGVVPTLQDVVADANNGGALYTSEGAVQRLPPDGASVASVTGTLDSDIPALPQSALAYDAMGDYLYASGSGNTYARINLPGGSVSESSYLGTLAKPAGSVTEIAWDGANSRLFFASGAATGVEVVTPAGNLVDSFSFTQYQRWGEIEYDAGRDQVFISAESESQVLRLELATGNYSALAGNGPALAAPKTLALDADRDRLLTISGSQLLALDPDTGTRTSLFDSSVGPGAVSGGFAGIWVAADSTRARAIDHQLGRYYQIDLRTGAKVAQSYQWADRDGDVSGDPTSADFLSPRDFRVAQAKFDKSGEFAAVHYRRRDLTSQENYLDLIALDADTATRISTEGEIIDFSFSRPGDQLTVLVRVNNGYAAATYALASGELVKRESLSLAAAFTPLALQAVGTDLYLLGRELQNNASVFSLKKNATTGFTTLTTFSDSGTGKNRGVGIDTLYDHTVLALLLPEQTPRFWDRTANSPYEMEFLDFSGSDQPKDFYTIDDYNELYFFRTGSGLHICWRSNCAIQAN